MFAVGGTETPSTDLCGARGRALRVPWWFRIAARLRGVAWRAGWIALVVAALGPLLALDADVALELVFLGWLLLVVAVVLDAGVSTPAIPPQRVGLPLRGRWRAHNSPADRLPSHRTHALGQTFAIDLVFMGEHAPRPAAAARALRPPEDFPGFGAEILAPAAGRVVAVSDGMRDHRSRSSADALRFMKLEGFVRSVAGARFLIGNRVVLDLGGGVYASLAHLKRRSVRVRRGEAVRAGDVIALCGNSGNSSEPHLHFQLIDHPREVIAAGVPFVFSEPGVASEGPGRLARGREVIAAHPEESFGDGSTVKPRRR